LECEGIITSILWPENNQYTLEHRSDEKVGYGGKMGVAVRRNQPLRDKVSVIYETNMIFFSQLVGEVGVVNF